MANGFSSAAELYIRGAQSGAAIHLHPHDQELSIHPRLRKLIGAVALLTLVTVWSLLAMALAQVVLVRGNGLLDFAYYATAGLGWVLPAMPLISWMSRGPEAR